MKSELSPETRPVEMTEREFLKYTFFKVGSQWRGQNKGEKETSRDQFTCIAMGIKEILNQIG